jgi:hypothetical protein
MRAEPRQLHFKRQLCVRSQGCSVNSEQQLQSSKGELRTVNVGIAKWKQGLSTGL